MLRIGRIATDLPTLRRPYPVFVETLGGRGRHLPAYVHQEFAAYLKCGRLDHGFLRVRCTACQAERLVAPVPRPLGCI